MHGTGKPAGVKVPWSYLPRQFDDETIRNILDEISELARSGRFTLGETLAEFELQFASLVGAGYAVGVASGTDAIKLGLRAVGVGPGDEVIAPANTFIATIGAIVECGAKPVLVDCTDDFCADVNHIEWAVTNRTKAIVPVHLTGQMVDMPALLRLAAESRRAIGRIPIVEDSCQCLLGEIDGRKSGTWGDCGAFSLHPLKNLNVWGDGGVVVTNDSERADRIRRLRNHGLADRDTHTEFGYNSRLDPLQAIVALHMLLKVEEITTKRGENAEYLDKQLSRIEGKGIEIPKRHPERRQVWHLYVVFAAGRDDLLSYLKRRGIEAKVHYPIPLHLQPALANLGYSAGDFPNAERHARSMISLPAHDRLTREELDYMISTIREFYSS